LSRYYSQFGKKESKLSIFPVLGRLSYQNSIQDKFNLGFALGSGAYVFHAIHTITQTNTYVEDYSHWKKGDVRKNVWISHFTSATPGVEESISFA
jgi:hypothetical protein